MHMVIAMNIEFLKLQTCRNDYILIDLLRIGPFQEKLMSGLARAMCRRHTGVGANGIIFLQKGEEFKISLRVFQPNGSESFAYHDPLVCAARFAFDSGLMEKSRITLETVQGKQEILAIDSSNFRLGLGIPLSPFSREPLVESSNVSYISTFTMRGRRYSLTQVQLLIPGVVYFLESVRPNRLKALNRRLQSLEDAHSAFQPVFTTVFSRDEVVIRALFGTRQPDYASAIGIGMVASVLNGFTDREVIVHCNSARCYAEWLERNNQVMVSMPAEYLFSGSYYFDESAYG